MAQHLERIRPPGRNDPCPCGSGKKYKRCCLLHEVATAPGRQHTDILLDLNAADAEGDAEGAIHVLEEAREWPHDPDLDAMLVERYLDLPADQAEPLLRRWWNQDHDRFSGAGLARLLIADGQKDEALEILSESQGNDAWPEYWRLLATLRDEQGETAAAASAMELFTRLVSENADAWMALADMQLRLGLHDRALQSLRRAGDLLPDRIEPRMARIRILADQTRWRETRDLAEALLEGSYADTAPKVLYELRDVLARAHFVLGYSDAARRLWESLLAEQPENVEIRCQLASLELATGRYQRVLTLVGENPAAEPELRLLDSHLRALLGLHEFDEGTRVAVEIERLDSRLHLLPLVRGAQAIADKEYVWGIEQLADEPPELYRDLWHNLRIDCLAYLGRWSDISLPLRLLGQGEDAVLVRATLGAMAAGKLDLAERLLAKFDDQQSLEARSLSALVVPVRQSQRAAESRRQQQIDQAEKQRWNTEGRELRRRIRDLEQHNAALAEALALSETAFQRLLEQVGVLSDDSGITWEAHVQGMADRAHKDALAQELRQAEMRLRGLLGQDCWDRLSESTRASLREGEWLFAALDGEDRDFGAALLEYARGLERAFKDAIFIPVRNAWQRQPGPTDRLQDEGHDPSLGPFVRFILQGSHLTLGSMAAALDRTSDVRRRGVAIDMLRRQIGIERSDDRVLADWKRTADRLAIAADARNQPAHAAAVTRDAVCQFRDLVLGTNGLIRALVWS